MNYGYVSGSYIVYQKIKFHDPSVGLHLYITEASFMNREVPPLPQLGQGTGDVGLAVQPEVP